MRFHCDKTLKQSVKAAIFIAQLLSAWFKRHLVPKSKLMGYSKTKKFRSLFQRAANMDRLFMLRAMVCLSSAVKHVVIFMFMLKFVFHRVFLRLNEQF